MSSKKTKTEIQCAYCDSVWDYSAYDKCPYCAAAPDMEQIEKAHAREVRKIKQKTEAESIKNPGKALSTWVASKVGLWAALVAVFVIGPFVLYCILTGLPKPKPSVEVQTVDSAEIVKHTAGTEFNVTSYLSVNVTEPSALVLKNSSISALIPEKYAALLVKVSVKSDGKNHGFYSVKKEDNAEVFGTPYIIADNVAYLPITSTDLRDLNITEPELKNVIKIDPDYSITANIGYLCYIVPENIGTCAIYFETAHYKNLIRRLDCIHAVELTVEEAEQ